MFATENYTSFSLFLVRERIQREFLLLKTCQIDVYSMPCPLVPTMTSLPVTILTANKVMKMIFLNDKMCYIFSQKNPKIIKTQNPQTRDRHFKLLRCLMHDVQTRIDCFSKLIFLLIRRSMLSHRPSQRVRILYVLCALTK